MAFETLETSGLLGAMSCTAREIVLPQGIFYWSGRAAKEAEINATIGSAQGIIGRMLGTDEQKVKTFYLPAVMDALKGLDSEQVAPYAPIAGLPGFRAAWRKWVVEKLSGAYEFDPGLVGTPIVVPGATAGIAYAAQLFLSPGDTVICHDRHWENYDLIYDGCQGVKVATVPLFRDGGLDIDALTGRIEEVAKKQHCAVAVLNFPNNPTGYMPTKAEAATLKTALIALAERLGGKKIILIFDDAYEGYVYESDAAPVSPIGGLIGAHPGIVAIKCDGTTKEFLTYGGRVAALTFMMHPSWGDPAEIQKALENKLGALLRGSISNCNRTIQEAVAIALEDHSRIARERETVRAILQERYDLLKTALATADLHGASPDPFNSGFFCSINLKPDAEQFADKMLREYKVGVVPLINTRDGINMVRVAFCSVEKEKINDMVDRLSRALA